MRRVILVLSLAWLFSASAQSPFLEAMRYVPAEAFLAETSNRAFFADIQAGFEVRAVRPPASWATLEPGSERAFFSALPFGTASSVITYLMVGGPHYPELLGLDFFDLTGTVEFGVPPDQALVLLGDVEPQRVSRAFMARGYRPEGPLLCPEAGCDTGRQQDVRNRQPGNPFGGDLGRSFPVFTAPGVLAGSASDVLARQMAASAAGELDSLADLPEVQAIDAVLSDMSKVLAVSVLNPLEFISFHPQQMLGRNLDADAAATLLAQLAELPLPAYSLIAFAATADDSNEYGHALLVYPDGEQASAAAAALDARLHSFTAQRNGLSYADTLADRGSELSPATVLMGANDGPSVVMITLTTALADTEDAPFTGLGYRTFINLVNTRDYLWLVPAN